MTFSQEFTKAIQARMLSEVASGSDDAKLATRFARVRRIMHREIERWVVARSVGSAPETPLQAHLNDSVEDIDEKFQAILDAMTEPVDRDAATTALTELAASLAGRMVALETRVMALESAVGA